MEKADEEIRVTAAGPAECKLAMRQDPHADNMKTCSAAAIRQLIPQSLQWLWRARERLASSIFNVGA